MANSRLALHEIFVDILETKGQPISRVYFQPPPTVRMEYPCIIYKRSDTKDFFSNDRIYLTMKKYSITIVDEDPDSLIPDKVAALPYCDFSTHFTKDNLNHDIYTIYF